MMALLGLLSLPARAADDLDTMSLEDMLALPVEISSRRAQPLAWSPAHVIVITRDQINERHYVNLKDILEDLPGVDVYGNHAPHIKSMISIRGVPGVNNFVILQDGQRISSATGEALDIEDNYPIFHAQKVEILLGPASAMYGADAMTGVINIISRDPLTRHGGAARFTYGTDNHLYGAGSLHTELGIVKLDVAAHLHQSDNPDLSEAYPSEMQFGPLKNPATGKLDVPRTGGYSNATSSSSVSARAHVGNSLELGYSFRTATHSTGVGEHPSTTNYGAHQSLRWQAAHMRHVAHLLPELQLESNVQLNSVWMAPDSGYDNIRTGYQHTYKAMSADSVTFLERATWDISEKHNFVSGVSWAAIHASPESPPLQRPLSNDMPPSLQGQTLPGSDLPIPFVSVDYMDFGAFARWQAQWLSTLSSTIGVRYDYDTRFGSIVNPRAGVVFQPTPAHTMKLLYGEAFLAPPPSFAYAMWGTFDGVDTASGKPTASFYHLPNPDLEPMTTATIEASYSGLLTRKLLVGAGAYHTAVEGIIGSVTTAEQEAFAGGLINTVERFQSNGRAKSYGGVLSANYRESFGKLKIDSWLSYSLSRGRSSRGPGARWIEPALLTGHKLKGGLTLRYGRFSLTPRVRYLGASTTTVFQEGSDTQRMALPSVTIVDVAFVATELVGKLTLTVDVRNLLDARYFLPSEAGSRALMGSPQDPRRVMAQIAYSF